MEVSWSIREGDFEDSRTHLCRMAQSSRPSTRTARAHCGLEHRAGCSLSRTGLRESSRLQTDLPLTMSALSQRAPQEICGLEGMEVSLDSAAANSRIGRTATFCPVTVFGRFTSTMTMSFGLAPMMEVLRDSKAGKSRAMAPGTGYLTMVFSRFSKTDAAIY